MADVPIITRNMPKQARAKARIRIILNATDTLLKESSLENITTTAIARSAGIPVGSVYQYFEDKNDILQQLYRAAYKDVEEQVKAAQAGLAPNLSFAEINRQLLQCFWQTARSHPTFRVLTRWANREYSFIEVTPDAESGLADLITETFKVSGVEVEPSRKDAVLTTTVTLVSVLVDAAIEEENEHKAEALIHELATVLSSYLG